MHEPDLGIVSPVRNNQIGLSQEVGIRIEEIRRQTDQNETSGLSETLDEVTLSPETESHKALAQHLKTQPSNQTFPK